MSSNGTTLASIASFIKSLEEQAQRILEHSNIAQETARRASFTDYYAFRRRVVEFEVFSMIVEGRIRDYFNDDARLRDQLAGLRLRVLNKLLGASIRFFDELSTGALPLGSRELFIAELKSLFDAKHQIAELRSRVEVPDDVEHNVRLAEKILREIIERAPSLLDFGAPMAEASA